MKIGRWALAGLLSLYGSAGWAGAYTVSQTSTWANGTGTLSVTAPTRAVGNLLLVCTAARAATETLSDPSGWTRLQDTVSTNNDSLILYGRIATNDASDNFSGDWSGSSRSGAQMAVLTGDIYSDLATIVAHSATTGVTTNLSTIPLTALTISTANTFVVGCGKRAKTASTDGATITAPAALTGHIGSLYPNGATEVGITWDAVQQTTATNISADSWTFSASESVPYATMTVALKTASAQAPTTWSFVNAGTFASGNGAATLTPGLPSGHASGDHLMWMGLERNSSNTIALPSGYAEVYCLLNGAIKYFCVADKIDGGSESAPSTTAVGPAVAQIAAFRGGPTSLSGLLHASASTSSTCSTNPPIPALTITQANTLVLGLAFQLDDYTGFTSNPSGFTTVAHNAADLNSDVSLLASYQVQTTATNISAGNFTTSGATSQTCRGVTLSLNPGQTAGTTSITSVNTTNSIAYTDTNRVATVVAAGASQGAGTFKLIDQAGSIKSTQSIDTWADTSIQFDPTQGNVRFGAITYELIPNASNTATLAGALTVPSGEWYSDISGIVALDFNIAGTISGRIRGQPNRYYDYPTDLANGDQWHCKRTGGSGNLTLNADGTFIADSTVMQIQCRIWHTNAWGSFQTWDLRGAAPTFSGPNP